MPKTAYASASQAKAILTKGRSKSQEYGETFYTLAKQIAAGVVGYDVTTDISHMAAIQHGNEYEPVAIAEYESRNMVQVHGQQKWLQLDHIQAGCTPDGLIGSDGMIEVKCPNSNNHLDNVLSNAQLALYLPQMQFSIWVTGRKWCDFISYDPRAPIGIDLHVVRVNRDEQMIKSLAERTEKLLDIANEYAEQLKSLLK